MNPLVLVGVAGVAWAWWSARKAKQAVSDSAQAVAEVFIGEREGTVQDLGSSELPHVAEEGKTSPRPGTELPYVIPRLLEILRPQDAEEVSRPGLLGQTYPVEVRWTNAVQMAWSGELIAVIDEEDRPTREVSLGRWTIDAGETRSAIVSIGFGGPRINVGRTLTQLRLRFGAMSAVATYYVD